MEFETDLAIHLSQTGGRVDDETDQGYEAQTDKNLPQFRHQ